MSIRGEKGEDGRDESSGGAPLSRVFTSGLASLLARSVGLSSSGWVKISLGEENLLISALTSLCLCSSLAGCSANFRQLSDLEADFLLNLD